ncbi:9034_t:CDS:2, partial [Scutellospora calospora]
ITKSFIMPYEYVNGNHKNSLNIESIARSPYLNRGTASPLSTRNALNITGLLPTAVETLEQQKKRALVQLRAKSSDLEKYMFLAWLRNTNVRLFYRLVIDELD